MKCQRSIVDTRHLACAFTAFVLFAGTTSGLAQTAVPPPDKSAPKGTMAPAEKKDSMKPGMPGMSASGGDMRGSMTGMMKGMESMQMTGDTDRDFAMMMKLHHQGAIDMAQQELQSGKDPKMRTMARRIIDAQKKEIKEFEQWLSAHK